MMDFKYALRSLSRNPIFAIGAIATLALGIGVNSTIFSLANAALFKPMPGVVSPSELVWISGLWRDSGRSGGMSYLEFLDYRNQSGDLFAHTFAFCRGIVQSRHRWRASEDSRALRQRIVFRRPGSDAGGRPAAAIIRR
jgi:hypothetical protein